MPTGFRNVPVRGTLDTYSHYCDHCDHAFAISEIVEHHCPRCKVRMTALSGEERTTNYLFAHPLRWIFGGLLAGVFLVVIALLFDSAYGALPEVVD